MLAAKIEGHDHAGRSNWSKKIGRLGGQATVEKEGVDHRGKSNFHSRIAKLAHQQRNHEGQSLLAKRLGLLSANSGGRDDMGRSNLAVRRGKISAASVKSKLARVIAGVKSRTRDGVEVAITGSVEIDGENFSLDHALFRFTHERANAYKITVNLNSLHAHFRCMAHLAKSKGWFSPASGSETQFV